MKKCCIILPIAVILFAPIIGQAQEPVQTWTLEETFLVSAIEVDNDGRIYAVDSERHEVRIFDASGALIRVIGQQGKAPGEFQVPRAIALGPDEKQFAVRDQNRRISFFSRDGTYEESFVLPKPILPSSSMSFVKDSVLVLGGFLPVNSEYEGNTLHALRTDGKLVRSFFARSDKAKEMKISVQAGSAFDLDHRGRINALQYSNYGRLAVLSTDGRQLNVFKISTPDHFRAPEVPQPNPMDDGRSAVTKWMKKTDVPRRLFVVGDDTVAVGVQEGGTVEEWTIDVIDKESGRVLGSTEFTGFPVYGDAEDGLVYVATAQQSPPATLLRAYRIEDLIGED